MPAGLGRALGIALRILALALLVVTLLPIIDTDQWWIRTLEFPRIQFIVLTGLCLAGFAVWERKQSWVWLAITGIAFSYQLYLIWPYTPVHPTEAVEVDNCPADRRIDLIAANVLQTNTNYAAAIDLVRAEDPDLFLALETDAKWTQALSVLQDEYPYSRTVPLDNTYGLALYSRLPLRDVEIRYTVEPDIPSLSAEVVMPGGNERVQIFALHPRPPLPGKDSGTRDAELVLSAQDVADAGLPVIVFGDLNDVAWSPTTQLFQELAGVLDPRVGRGFFPTYNADLPLMRWPLDHVFFTEEFALADFRLLPDIGSDHFPVAADLCLQPETAPAVQDEPQVTADTLEEASEQLQEGIDQQREETQSGADETVTPEPD